jgi:hypothetical protein
MERVAARAFSWDVMTWAGEIRRVLPETPHDAEFEIATGTAAIAAKPLIRIDIADSRPHQGTTRGTGSEIASRFNFH